MWTLEEELPLQRRTIVETETEDETRSTKATADNIEHDFCLSRETTCGFWIFKGPFFQRFANESAYVGIWGLVSCVHAMSMSYFMGSISTIEKRLKIPSTNTGIILVANEIGHVVMAVILSYYAGRGHKPRWMGFGLLNIVLFCLLTASPHFLYGSGEDALALTTEFGAMANANSTLKGTELCNVGGEATKCELHDGSLAPQIVLLVGQILCGIGSSLFHTLGITYMDDNTKKSKSPALMSISFFIRMMGPSFGYALASFCLRIYISPGLHPVIDNSDPRWMGAWWLGWLILGGLMLFFGTFLTMFPKQLPKEAARRKVLAAAATTEDTQAAAGASLNDMLKTFKSLLTNKILMWNNFSSVFYFFGYEPYWTFMVKYIEIQYRQTASTSSLATGTVAFVFTAVGILGAGFIISKYKPRARYLAAWNVIVGFLTVIGIVSYAFIGCPGNETSVVVNIHDSVLRDTTTCNSACQCDYVPYSPVCGENGMTYISACHAGCKEQQLTSSGSKIFRNCSCISTANRYEASSKNAGTEAQHFQSIMQNHETPQLDGQATPGACAIDCFRPFLLFLVVMCFMNFLGGAGRASNVLVSLRCVPEKDKTSAMGFAVMLTSLLSFIPAPVFFGWLLDQLCVVWGKTCTNNGNCWLYDPRSLRYALNLTAAVFIVIGTLFDVGTWYYVKDLKIFDEEVKAVEVENMQPNAEKRHSLGGAAIQL